MAPEIINENKGSSKVDIFSLGCVLYQLSYDNKYPFCKES
jgi:serine/threonine protein kinase